MINNLSLLRALLAEDGANSIHELMRPAADQVKEDMALNCDNLIQRSWLSALQSLSQVHLATSHIKAGPAAHLRQAERHQIKDALAAFNTHVEKTLANDEIHIDDRDLR
eukprot:CAMPEP_0179466912 /NCGR_PEP_ID=MMETSP0799-20121207/48154_1 /TAXON_ID=46947 /ORGANISM="Geminigera cryophila, Strain CCMP2564" /LENGTH=108 /DNA_ID=CAMNT_0021272021 /DNA_START=1 /DNA_END=324 /DNA_ORIENTATION=+